ncbi:MAG: FGGY family carbohydrate kinase, partial [Verrucomicrobiota bacterium]
MQGVVLGVDVGTSGVRALAMDAHGRVLGSASRRLPETSVDGRRRTQSPQDWWNGLTECLLELGRSTDLSHTVAIAVDGTSGTLLGLDERLNPIGPARMYDDSDTGDLPELISRLAPPESAAHGPTSAAARALQLSTAPGVTKVVHQADWILLKLGAREAVSDENNALKTGYDPVTRRWPEWLGRLGLRTDTLPKVLPAGTPVGRICKAAADSLGLPHEVTLVT